MSTQTAVSSGIVLVMFAYLILGTIMRGRF